MNRDIAAILAADIAGRSAGAIRQCFEPAHPQPRLSGEPADGIAMTIGDLVGEDARLTQA
jgi:hypothetical protein